MITYSYAPKPDLLRSGMFYYLNSRGDPQKTVNMTLWETKEEMDNYYANDRDYSEFLESLKPLIEQEIEKSDYTVFKLNLGG
jgi:hypothetical protein